MTIDEMYSYMCFVVMFCVALFVLCATYKLLMW